MPIEGLPATLAALPAMPGGERASAGTSVRTVLGRPPMRVVGRRRASAAVSPGCVRQLTRTNPHRLVTEVSYGEKRRLEIAMALAQEPKLLLLDEPLAGLSAEERRTVQALLEEIPRDITIVMIEHDIDAALAFAERITVLHYGKVIVQGTRQEVVDHPRTREVYLGA